MPDHSDKAFGQQPSQQAPRSPRDIDVVSPMTTEIASKKVPSLDLSLGLNPPPNNSWNVETTRIPLRSARGDKAADLSTSAGGPQFLNSNKTKTKRPAPQVEKTTVLGKGVSSPLPSQFPSPVLTSYPPFSCRLASVVAPPQ